MAHLGLRRTLASSGVILFCLVGCRGSDLGGSSSTPSTACDSSETHSYDASDIRGGQHLYFGNDLLALLDDPDFVVTSIDLSIDIASSPAAPKSETAFKPAASDSKPDSGDDDDHCKGKANGHGNDPCDRGMPAPAPDSINSTVYVPGAKTPARLAQHAENVSISLNGVYLNLPDSALEIRGGTRVYHLQKMRMNAGRPAVKVMALIRQHKGEVRLSLWGKDVKATSAKLTINGYRQSQCNPNPSPSPSPTPSPTAAAAPTATLMSETPAATQTNSTTMQFDFSADQPTAGFVCSLDSSPFTPCDSPLIYSGLQNGAHHFAAKAINEFGLESQLITYDWTVDTLPSSVTIAPVTSPTNSASVDISFTAHGSGRFLCVLDGGAEFACTSPLQLLGLSEGDHSLEVSRVDSSRHRGAAATVFWQIDLTAPTTTILTSVPSESPSSANTRQITFSANESSRFECAFDSGVFASCVSPMDYRSLTEGWHSFSVRAIDAAGNVGQPATLTWQNDYTPPILTLSSVLPAAGNSNASQFNLQFASSKPGSFVCSVDGAAEQACVSPWSQPFGPDGVHSVSVVAIDTAGLRSAAQVVQWTIDTTAPLISFASILPSASARLSSTSIELDVSSPETVSLQASLDGAPFAAIAMSALYSGLSEGNHTVVIQGTDLFGNALIPLTHSFTVDVTPPVLQLSANLTGLTNQTVNSFTLIANEAATFECNLDGAGFGPCGATQMYSGLTDGAHTFQARATDLAGNVSNIQTSTWTVDTVAPTTSVSSTQLAANSFSFSLMASEPGSTFVCSFDGAAQQPCTSPLVESGLSVGSHSLIVFAIDAAGNRDTVGAQIAVQVQQLLQTILLDPGIILTNQNTFTFNFSSNQSTATFLCSLDGAAATPCTSPMTYTGLNDGSHTFLVQAKAQDGTIDAVGQSHTWTVDTVAPVILTASLTSTTTTISVIWTTDEAATAQLAWGIGTTLTNTTPEQTYSTSHTIVLNGLNPNTVYSIQVSGHDAAGNVYTGAKQQIRTRF